MDSPPQGGLQQFTRSLSKILTIVLTTDAINILRQAWKIIKRLFPLLRQTGSYEVLSFQAVLELRDSKGKTAIYHKQERVRFLQNNVIAYQDLVWGDGEIFADYQCSPDVAVDRYRQGRRWWVLISLRETKNRGDVEEFRIVRTICNGFVKPRESFQTEVNHRTHVLSAGIIFPRSRYPKRVALVEQNRNRTTALGAEHQVRLPDGRLQVVWRKPNPPLFEKYVLQWEW